MKRQHLFFMPSPSPSSHQARGEMGQGGVYLKECERAPSWHTCSLVHLITYSSWLLSPSPTPFPLCLLALFPLRGFLHLFMTWGSGGPPFPKRFNTKITYRSHEKKRKEKKNTRRKVALGSGNTHTFIPYCKMHNGHRSFQLWGTFRKCRESTWYRWLQWSSGIGLGRRLLLASLCTECHVSSGRPVS